MQKAKTPVTPERAKPRRCRCEFVCRTCGWRYWTEGQGVVGANESVLKATVTPFFVFSVGELAVEDNTTDNIIWELYVYRGSHRFVRRQVEVVLLSAEQRVLWWLTLCVGIRRGDLHKIHHLLAL